MKKRAGDYSPTLSGKFTLRILALGTRIQTVMGKQTVSPTLAAGLAEAKARALTGPVSARSAPGPRPPS